MEKQPDFKIIVIDDNPAIHHDFIKILTASAVSEIDSLSSKLFGKKTPEYTLPKFEITTASQGKEGAELVKQALEDHHPYALAFVDIRMPPGWDGIETIKHLWSLDKDLQAVICTAYSDYSWEDTVAALGKTDNLLILKKPFDQVAVRQLACALTKKWELAQVTRNYTTILKSQVEDRTLSLQKSLSLVKATLESSNDGILVVNDKGKIIDYNQKFIHMWNIPNDVIEKRDETETIAVMKANLANPEKFENYIKELHKKSSVNSGNSIDVVKFTDGRIVECFSQAQKFQDQTVGLVLNFHDVTKRAKLEEKLQFQAMHDDLTGLPNRIMLLDRLNLAISAADLNNTISAVMFLDLDRFKLINDSLSHAVGDELLKKTSERLQTVMRAEDTLARLGGDEFVLVFPNIAHTENVVQIAKKVQELFHEPFRLADRDVTVSASIGVSIYPQHGKSVSDLLSNADAAMYCAKRSGTNAFQFYTQEMNENTLAKLDDETQLRKALQTEGLFLCYQPEFDLTNEKIIAVEALIRWNHPEKGLLLPMDFIPLAEETGLIVPLGEWVMYQACKQNKAWQDEGLPPMRVAVNVVAQQLKQKDFIATVREILQKTGLKPEYLEIELTENVIISSVEVMKMITELKELGVYIAVDDFGTGYSSLSYLNKVPLDRLKIDSTFIRNIKHKGDDDVIIRAIIAMANKLSIDVLAEGVETEYQLEYLKSHHCDEVQGYFYSKPLPANEIKNYILNIKKLNTSKANQ